MIRMQLLAHIRDIRTSKLSYRDVAVPFFSARMWGGCSGVDGRGEEVMIVKTFVGGDGKEGRRRGMVFTRGCVIL